MAGIKFLDLIDDESRPMEKATFKQLSDTMTETYGVSGDTLDKVIRFFLSATKYAEIPVSPLLEKTASPRRRSGARKSAAASAVPQMQIPSIAPTPPSLPAQSVVAGGNTRTVTLKSGGTVTISMTVDVFKLKGADREFVFNLTDALDRYEEANQAESAVPLPPTVMPLHDSGGKSLFDSLPPIK